MISFRILLPWVLMFGMVGNDVSAQVDAGKANDAQASEARDILTDFLSDLDILRDQSVAYSGTYLLSRRGGLLNGEHPFAGFWAQSSSGQERFWQVKDYGGNTFGGLGECFDSLRLSADEKWVAGFGGNPQEFEEDKHAFWVERYSRLDPSVALLCYPGGILGGYTLKGKAGFSHVATKNVVTGIRGDGSFTVVIEVPDAKVWMHLRFTESQGMRPTLFAVTPAGQHLAKDEQNAVVLNHARWRKHADGLWRPEAGENTDYYGGTSGDFKSVLKVKYKCDWLSPDDLPPNTFKRQDMTSHAHVRLKSSSSLLSKVGEIKDVGNP